MPYSNVPAELFMSHNGVNIYHIYNDDFVENGPRDCWYCTNDYGSDNDPHGPEYGVFDIRNLPGFDNDRDVKDLIAENIDGGYFDDYDKEETPEPKELLEGNFRVRVTVEEYRKDLDGEEWVQSHDDVSSTGGLIEVAEFSDFLEAVVYARALQMCKVHELAKQQVAIVLKVRDKEDMAD